MLLQQTCACIHMLYINVELTKNQTIACLLSTSPIVLIQDPALELEHAIGFSSGNAGNLTYTNKSNQYMYTAGGSIGWLSF